MPTLLEGEDVMNVARPRRRWTNRAGATTAAGGWATPAHRRSRSVVPPSGSLRSRVADARAVGFWGAWLAWPPPCCTLRGKRGRTFRPRACAVVGVAEDRAWARQSQWSKRGLLRHC